MGGGVKGLPVLSFGEGGKGGGLENAMSSAGHEQHQAARCATGRADRTTEPTIDWNGVGVSASGAFRWPQTTVVVA